MNAIPLSTQLARIRANRWWCDYCGLELSSAERRATVRWNLDDSCPASPQPNGRHGCCPVKVSHGLQRPGGGYDEPERTA